MSPAYAASLGQACQAYEKVPKEKGTHKTEHIKVNFRLHILKRIYTAASSSGHLPPLHRTYHYMQHKSLVGTLFLTPELFDGKERSCCVCKL